RFSETRTFFSRRPGWPSHCHPTSADSIRPNRFASPPMEPQRRRRGSAAFLTAAGFGPGETRGFTAGLLLDLGGMVRLRAWEAAGLDVHRRAGLPTAHRTLE